MKQSKHSLIDWLNWGLTALKNSLKFSFQNDLYKTDDSSADCIFVANAERALWSGKICINVSLTRQLLHLNQIQSKKFYVQLTHSEAYFFQMYLAIFFALNEPRMAAHTPQSSHDHQQRLLQLLPLNYRKPLDDGCWVNLHYYFSSLCITLLRPLHLLRPQKSKANT